MTDHSLLVSFPDQSHSFVHGYEAGMIWEMMQRGDPLINRTVHAANVRVLQRMAEASGYTAEFGETEFIEYQFAKFRRGAGTGGERLPPPRREHGRELSA